MSPPPAPWKVLAGSAAGSSHGRTGTPCQDYALAAVVGPVAVLACADGVGSAARAEVGAALACRELLSAATAAVRDGLAVEAVTPEVVAGWYERARRRLALEACFTGADLRDFACTLLAAVVGPDAATFAQVGDGAVVFRGASGLEPAFWPEPGEYANCTDVLTAQHFDRSLRVRSVGFGPDEVALLTDGLQPLALHYATRTAHAPFFDPMFAALRAEADPDRLAGPLRAFLGSGPVTARTDDDTTLVLATRRTADAPA